MVAMRIYKVILVAFLLSVSITTRSWASPTLDELEEVNDDALQSHRGQDGFSYDDSDETLKLIKRKWTLEEMQVIEFLTQNPNPSTEDFNAIEEGTMLRLGADQYLIANENNLFIVARVRNRLTVVWNIKNAIPQYQRAFPILTAWLPSAPMPRCGKIQNVPFTCGVLDNARIGLLPKKADGRVRFYVDVIYSWISMPTIPNQFSVWEWDGKAAKPLVVKAIVSGQEDELVQLVDTNIRIPVLDQFKSFYQGREGGRPLRWTLHVTPNSVDDLGQKAVTPELDLIDDLFDRIRRKIPTDEVGDPAAVVQLTEILSAAWDKFPNEWPKWYLGEYSVTQDNERYILRASVTFPTHGHISELIKKNFIFHLENRNGRLYLSSFDDLQKDTSNCIFSSCLQFSAGLVDTPMAFDPRLLGSWVEKAKGDIMLVSALGSEKIQATLLEGGACDKAKVITATRTTLSGRDYLDITLMNRDGSAPKEDVSLHELSYELDSVGNLVLRSPDIDEIVKANFYGKLHYGGKPGGSWANRTLWVVSRTPELRDYVTSHPEVFGVQMETMQRLPESAVPNCN